MERTLGLDVQAASSTLAVLSEKGRKLRVGNLDKTVFQSPRPFTRLRDL